MNVILLAPLPPPYGGIAGWTKRMQKCILKNNWKVIVVDEKVIGGRTVFGEYTKKNYFVEVKRCINIWTDLNRKLRDNESHVVHACIPAGTTSMAREIVSAIITKMHQKKFIVHFRCTLPNMVSSFWGKLLFGILINLSDEIFLLNNKSVEFLMETNPNKKYRLIPNFISVDEIYEEKEYKEKIQKVVYVGGVVREKGCDVIIEVAKSMPNIEFLLVGKIGIEKEDIPSNVKLLGERDKEFVQDILKEADVFMFLSRFIGEGFSNALAEAMAFSIPCIVSDWAANKDMIEDKGGIVIEEVNTQNAVDALKLLESFELRSKYGEWNRRKVLECYCENQITDMYVDEYEELIGKREI